MDQHWFRKWLIAWSAPSHYLNQCWNIVNLALRSICQWNINRYSRFFIHRNAFANAVCEMAAILSRERWVNKDLFRSLSHIDLRHRLILTKLLSTLIKLCHLVFKIYCFYYIYAILYAGLNKAISWMLHCFASFYRLEIEISSKIMCCCHVYYHTSFRNNSTLQWHWMTCVGLPTYVSVVWDNLVGWSSHPPLCGWCCRH